jgi:hypothetical protein
MPVSPARISRWIESYHRAHPNCDSKYHIIVTNVKKHSRFALLGFKAGVRGSGMG